MVVSRSFLIVSVLQILITLLVVTVLSLVLVLGVMYVVRRNQNEPPVNRKWTDPKFHD